MLECGVGMVWSVGESSRFKRVRFRVGTFEIVEIDSVLSHSIDDMKYGRGAEDKRTRAFCLAPSGPSACIHCKILFQRIA